MKWSDHSENGRFTREKLSSNSLKITPKISKYSSSLGVRNFGQNVIRYLAISISLTVFEETFSDFALERTF